MKTLLQAVADVRNLILERAGNDGLVTDTELKTLIQMANRAVWKEAAKKAPALFEEDPAEVDVPAGGVLAFAALPGAPEVQKVNYVEQKVGETWVPIHPLADRGDRFVHEPGVGGYAQGRVAAGWYPRGVGIRFSPPPVAGFRARITYTKVPAELGDNDPLLSGRLGLHHDAVLFKAAMLAYSKDEEEATPYDDEYAEAKALLLRDLAEEQGMDGRRVRARGPWDD